MTNLRVTHGKNSILSPTPTLAELDTLWLKYVRACDRLSEMRHQDSEATQLAIQNQYQLTENLLQNWIEVSSKFKATLN